MDSLPFEVSSKIFRSALGTFSSQPQAFVALRDIICCVSRTWRSVGLADALLWRNVYVSPRINRDLIVLRLSRASTLPLVLYVLIQDDLDPSHPFYAWFTNTLGSSLPRTTELFVVSPNLSSSVAIMMCLSLMTGTSLTLLHLDIRIPSVSDVLPGVVVPFSGMVVPIPFGGLMPALTRLSMRRTFLIWNSPPTYHGLQELKLFHFPRAYLPPVVTIVDTIRSVPALTRLHLRGINCIGDIISTHSRPILRHLTHLALFETSSGVVNLLQQIDMPILHTLHIVFSESDYIAYGDIPLDSLFAGFTTAIVTVDSSNVNLVAGFLRRLRGVRRLDLRANTQQVAIAFHHMMFLDPRSVPELQCVLLPTFQPSDFVLQYFRRADPLLSSYHLVFPSSWSEPFDLVEYFLQDKVPVHQNYFGSRNYWDN
ncbi:hypothetical protein B0H16DRAFT_1749578 [Mycena metata]|uniref:F-box domain-containing protein n=1 Tax=Mycena metata TaxID=1033252 RepID=A0AAD7DTS9_9AGAR|nr:hypothetical protein B0H16DRAFT_1749578 [Mycena metata]